ncbi:hypothetical protein P5673_024669 [Acropora cervicornis]|uniref:Uncharacterized protein n=1 Tax=Acropora cervicornis TaxID=6130 RepID=A0AAD9Q3D1_ACRCE|nr:hypothetical protein P5673_024669 [Acropora cervicornis]
MAEEEQQPSGETTHLIENLSAPSSSSAFLMAFFTESLISLILAGSSEGSAFNSSVSIFCILFATFS